FNPKEGIDNPAMVISDDAEPCLRPTLRLCILKREEGESFSFHLRVEKGCLGRVIRHVTPCGVVERGGLRDGDRLLQVAMRMKLSGRQLCLLVLDIASGFGVNFLLVEGEKGRISVSLVSGGPAERAGVCRGDRLLWIDGNTVSELTNSVLSKMVKKCRDHMTILVIDSESEQSYVRWRMPILPTLAGSHHNLPHSPRKLQLVPGPKDCNHQCLCVKCFPSLAHVMREVDQGSTAEMAAIKNYYSLNVDKLDWRFQRKNQWCCPLCLVLCVLQKGPLGFGINLGCVQDTPGIFVSQVALWGSGSRAGLLVGNVVMEVNGQNMEENCLENVMVLVQEGGHSLSLLVVEKSGYNKLGQSQSPFTAVEATVREHVLRKLTSGRKL
uniref:NHERF family PDZ scaffold protein 4b n=1 Tax=Oncorhynchus mykiss TaxID=8022 RepID=A0A8C7W1K4_ONCMY